MIDQDNDKWPKKLSLIDRSQNTFEAYLSSKYGERFYREEFLKGISERKKETHAAVVKTSANCFIFTSLLAFLSAISGKITFLGLTVEISNDLAPILALLAASALLGTVQAFIDDFMLNGFINKIGSQLGLYSFQLFLLDKMAINLWVDTLKPRYFGDQSGNGHKIVMFLHGLIGLIIMLSMLSYPVTFIALSAHTVFYNEDAVLAAQLLTLFSIIILFWILIIIVIFTVPFKFYKADFHEVDNEPTDHFKSKLEEEMLSSQSDNEHTNDKQK